MSLSPTYVVKVSSRVADCQLHEMDQSVKGFYRAFLPKSLMKNAEMAEPDVVCHILNAFHSDVAIKILDDFEITVQDYTGRVCDSNDALSSEELYPIDFEFLGENAYGFS